MTVHVDYKVIRSYVTHVKLVACDLCGAKTTPLPHFSSCHGRITWPGDGETEHATELYLERADQSDNYTDDRRILVHLCPNCMRETIKTLIESGVRPTVRTEGQFYDPATVADLELFGIEPPEAAREWIDMPETPLPTQPEDEA